MDSKIWMTASTCTEVPTVGWMCLKRTDATRPYSGYGYSGPASCLMDLVILLKRRMISEVLTLHCRWQSGLSRSGLWVNLVHTMRELLSVPVLVRSCTVALFHWNRCRWCQTSLLPRTIRTGTSLSPYTTYPPPPTTLLQLSFLLLHLFPLIDLMLLPSPPPQLLLTTLPLRRYTSHSQSDCHSVVLLLAIPIPTVLHLCMLLTLHDLTIHVRPLQYTLQADIEPTIGLALAPKT